MPEAPVVGVEEIPLAIRAHGQVGGQQVHRAAGTGFDRKGRKIFIGDDLRGDVGDMGLGRSLGAQRGQKGVQGGLVGVEQQFHVAAHVAHRAAKREARRQACQQRAHAHALYNAFNGDAIRHFAPRRASSQRTTAS